MTVNSPVRQVVLICLSFFSTTVAAFADEPSIDFAAQIAPIFEQHCVRCHSPGNPKGELSLAGPADLRDAGYVVSGDPSASHLLDVITAVDGGKPEMPKDGEPLSESQVALVRRWIADGAVWPQDVIVRERSKADATWWSLRPLRTVEPPSPEGLPESWSTNPVDRFVYAKLSEDGLQPNPPANRRELIRRATYDLLGLPPTPEEVEAFVNDPGSDAYEKLLDRLLESPHYGERWGRHWLDVVRFGESNGYERNFIINNLWPFRDFVIDSLNDDKPFDRFIREHMAGDVFGRGEYDVEVGSAFLVAGPFDDVGNQDAVQAAQIRANTIDEIIRSTGEAFLGLTIGCARCHDHKFDPILQRDYYAWYATFSGVRHGSRVLATPEEQAARAEQVRPLEQQRNELTGRRDALQQTVFQRALSKLPEYEAGWTREPANRQATEERFDVVQAKFVRLVSEGQDINITNAGSFGIDEFEIWTPEPNCRNVALASAGAVASGASRQIKDFPGAYGPHIAIDGKSGERFLATGGRLTIELAEPTTIERVVFSSARGEDAPEQRKFAFVAEYRIEVSTDGENWVEVANSHDRRPVNVAHRDHRLRQQELAPDERKELSRLNGEIAAVNRELAAIPPLPNVWVGNRVAADAKGPFHVFVGGSPQRKGEPVVPASLNVLDDVAPGYQLSAEADEAARRNELADWITHADNPLTPRVLANRVWHYHFGTGIVDTPSDFGYMGGRPTHPELLDWLAGQLLEHEWRLKPLHKLVMMSQTYRQSSDFREDAARVDGDSRLLWRFPPRRLSAEEIRDTVLMISGKLDTRMGGPGFRLYDFLQDNVATYVPRDDHGPDTYRRAVYHQNARASVVDLMSDFDQPDCAFSTPKRAETTTPLQALTMLNHQFTLDMAGFLAERLRREAGDDIPAQVQRAYRLCYGRIPTDDERSACQTLIQTHGLTALCRVLLNTSELIYVK